MEQQYREQNAADLAWDYSMKFAVNVNLQRMAPDLIDGLKPVQRRSLYVMYLTERNRQYRKLASIAGDVFGKAHPHLSSIEGAIVGIVQEWKNLIPFIDGDGNWGTSSGDPAGAGRYITARLSDFAIETFFKEWNESAVDMVQSDLDPSILLPLYLPAKYPVVLLNGNKGIGFGASTDTPSFNFRELINATISLIKDPKAPIVLIPDIQTGASIVATDFAKLCENGRGSYTERCRWEVDDERNVITITALPIDESAYKLREKLQELIDSGQMPELISVRDHSGKDISIELKVRDDVSPYKLMRELVKNVSGLQKSVNFKLQITYNRQTIDFSVRGLLLEWINWRRDQKNIVLANKRARLNAEFRMNEVKLFVISPDNLSDTIEIFRTAKNRADIEKRLIEKYGPSEIRMDSYLANVLSNMRMIELCEESYEKCLKRREELTKELDEVVDILSTKNGVDKIIIAELQDGAKRFGGPRRSSVVPEKISITNEVEGYCTLQLSSDGVIKRTMATNCEMEPVPNDTDGYACIVDNDSSFILVNEFGNHTFIRVKEIPLDTELPVMRFATTKLVGSIVAMLPVNMNENMQCVLVSKFGSIKRIGVRDIGPSKKPLIQLSEGDTLTNGILVNPRSQKDILVYTKNGMGQRFRPDSIRATLPTAAGRSGFALQPGDEILGCFAISADKEYLLYTTVTGKMRLNYSSYLPTRNSKNDAMVQLIQLSARDKLIAVKGCHKLDTARVYFNDGSFEDIELKHMKESTMSSPPVKMTSKNAVSNSVVKVKII